MNERDTSSSPRLPPVGRGVLRREQPQGAFRGERLRPPASLAAFVHHCWWLRWDLRAPFTAEVLPHPAGRIIFEVGPAGARAEVEGVFTTRQAKTRVARGELFGVQFRPAMLQGLLGQPMSTITDRVVPFTRVFGRAQAAWVGTVCAAAEVDEKMALLTAFLLPRLRVPTPELVALRDVVERLGGNRSVLRVDDVSAALALDTRALQRRFLRYVGVGPKWVIQRLRLIEAAEQLRSGKPLKLAALADELGYADQAHFARDFKRVTGSAPGAFRRR